MQQVNVLLRGLRSIRSFYKSSSISEPEIKHSGYNRLLAKWEEHYRRYPNKLSYRSGYATLNYLTPAD